MHGSEDGVDVQAAMIRWRLGQVKVGEVANMKLMEEVLNFRSSWSLIAQLVELAVKLQSSTSSVPRPPVTISCHLNAPQFLQALRYHMNN